MTKWELVTDEVGFSADPMVRRIQVPNGWIYLVGDGVRVAVFVPGTVHDDERLIVQDKLRRDPHPGMDRP